MSRVITFSRFFPKKHPRAGEPTFFVEKIWQGLHTFPLMVEEIANHDPALEEQLKNHYTKIYDPKWHTIREGKRWKVGDWFHPRVWSGVAYRSPQVDISIPIQIKKIWEFDIDISGGLFLNKKYLFDEHNNENWPIDEVALNDGLETTDLLLWFKAHSKKDKAFYGQILCWNDKIEY